MRLFSRVRDWFTDGREPLAADETATGGVGETRDDHGVLAADGGSSQSAGEEAPAVTVDHDETDPTETAEVGETTGGTETARGDETDHTEPADGDETAGETEEDELNVDDDLLLDSIGSPVFMIDTDGEVVAWNEGLAELTGVDDETALGQTDAGALFYADGRGERTLAQKVLEAPERAHESFDVQLRDPELLVYAADERVVDPTGDTHFCEVTARPLFEDGEFVAVVQTVIDNTTEVRRRESIEGLVEEIQTTLQALMAGNLDARASFVDEHDCLESEVLGVTEDLNQTAAVFEETAADVDEQARQLRQAVKRANDAAQQIARTVGDQNELLEEGVSEMQTFSASMEEVAATAEQVDQAAAQARDAAVEGLETSEDARAATEEVTDIGQELVDSVTQLGDRMDEIEEVVEVISDVADQTNLLALNANIEAARAGEEGDGFAVVAEEVKSLADETRSHTEDITANIEQLQSETDETVVAAEQSHEQIDHAAEQIEDVLAAFEEIADAIDEAADGITEVSRATDDQAATVEELTSTIEDVRERSDETEDAARDIVEATERQDDAIDDLTDRVADLRGKAAADGGRRGAPDPAE
jgi:methyl-accepting chemotaxis protein